MNNHIREWAEQAADYCKTQPREMVGTMWEEKFAKLIIEQCGEIADLAHTDNCGLPSMVINSYFGIEK